VATFLAAGGKLPPAGDFNNTGRGYPDVSALGHNYIIWLGGQPMQVDGTSCSAPVWGAIVGLVNAARLAANFAISAEAQAFGAKFGRIPVRADVTPNPPDALTRLKGRTIIPVVFGPEDERKWKRQFDELFRPR
jgi:hypothetical protein